MFQVDLFQLKRFCGDLNREQTALGSCIEQVEDCIHYFEFRTQGMDSEIMELHKILEQLENNRRSLKKLEMALERVCEMYENTEQRIIDLENEDVIQVIRPEFTLTNLSHIRQLIHRFLE
jgi:predicted patatin/cPLA2 family phospholipase